MLYFIGLGLGDAKDITVKGLEVVKSAKKVFLEHYTSILSCGKTDLEEFYGRNDLILADRDLVESGADEILEDAKVGFSKFVGCSKNFLSYVLIPDTNPGSRPNWESRNLVTVEFKSQMPCPSMGPKFFWTVQIILVEYIPIVLDVSNSFWPGPNYKD